MEKSVSESVFLMEGDRPLSSLLPWRVPPQAIGTVLASAKIRWTDSPLSQVQLDFSDSQLLDRRQFQLSDVWPSLRAAS